MAYNYCVYAQKPTCVSHSCSGNFTSPSDVNLIMCKNQYIQVNKITEEGVSSVVEFEVPGRVETMSLFRPTGERTDVLFITTRDTFFTLGYVDGKIETLSNGSIEDSVGRRTETGSIAIIDPQCRAVALSLYEGLLKVIPFDNNKSQFKEAFNLRIEELNIIDIAFFESISSKKKPCKQPTFAILYQDNTGSRHLMSYEINLLEKELSEGTFKHLNIDRGSNILIPVSMPLGGMICIGESQITYFDEKYKKSVDSPSNTRLAIRCYGNVDPTRWLLGDQSGTLYLLRLQTNDNNEVTGLILQELGITSIASCISYLDNGFIFVGSYYGDSQVVRIEGNNETGNNLQPLHTYTNIGPIVDFCFVDSERQGQGQIVTCSGAFKDGSLRVIRNGIGIEELTSIGELTGLSRVWSLKVSLQSRGEKYLVMGFTKQTMVFAVEDESLGPIVIPGFDSDAMTVCCDTVIGDCYLQVTENSARLISSSTLELIDEWKPNNARISLAASNPTQLVVSLGEGKLVYLEISPNGFKQVQQTKLEYEVSCIDISAEENQTSSPICAVGMWTEISVRILKLPTFEHVTTQQLGGEILPRSILLATFENISYLLCGLGDGNLFSFKMDRNMGILTDKKRVSIGTKPVMLRPFLSKDNQLNVFAASDKPTVIYSRNQKLVYSNVNLGEVSDMCSFHHESFQDQLAIASENSVLIGQIDEIQKLHIKDIPLHAQPMKICHQESSQTYGVLITQFEEPETSAIYLLDEESFEKKSEIRLEPNEIGQSIVSCKFEDDYNDYYIVGTAITEPEEDEPSKGRLIVLQVQDGKLIIRAEKEVKGSVMALCPFNGKILASGTGRLNLFKWTENQDETKELVLECSCGGGVQILNIHSKGDFILISDMMKSIHLFVYKQDDTTVNGKIELICKDYQYSWLIASEMFDEHEFIASDNTYNLFTLQKNEDATTEEERKKLIRVGKYHLADQVNKIVHGFIGMRVGTELSLPGLHLDKDGTYPVKTLIFGTISGGIGVIAKLPKETFDYFNKVQIVMSNVAKGLANMPRDQYRAFRTERSKEQLESFLDGDFIESFLEFDVELQRKVVEELNREDAMVTLEELAKQIEDLGQLLH
ncbi:hypothetical protein ABK040_009884 [Willaertia magna]